MNADERVVSTLRLLPLEQPMCHGVRWRGVAVMDRPAIAPNCRVIAGEYLCALRVVETAVCDVS